MKSIRSYLRMAAVITLVVVLTACSVSPQPAAQPTLPPQPTVDLPALHTQVAQTVVAQITLQAALNPTSTLPAPTPTDVPAALAPTPTPPLTAIPTLAPPATQAPAAFIAHPTNTKTPYTDSCVLQSTSPADYSAMSAGSSFEAYWVVKNTGMRPWNTRFYFSKVKGDLGYSGTIFLASPVAEGSEYTLHISMTAPTSAGSYNGTYKLVNDDGVAICQFFVAISVK